MTYFPPMGSEPWETVAPADAGWDAARLDAALDFAGEKQSTGFAVLHEGRIMAERYWGTGAAHVKRDIASAQKSITSALVGIALQEGLFSLDTPSSSFLGDGWSNATPEQERRITLRHHLSMCTGLEEDLTFEADPGTFWYYNNRTYHIIKTGLERVAGKPLDDWSREMLWARIGMQDTNWVTRIAPAGVPRNLFAFGPEDAPFSALMTTVRDMARFGLLVQNFGEWADTPILRDRAYLAASTDSSQEMNPAYGYLWWLNGKASYLNPGRRPGGDGALIPAGPADLICALGAGDQKIYISRSLGTVIVRQGDPAGTAAATRSEFDNELWTKLMAAAPRV